MLAVSSSTSAALFSGGGVALIGGSLRYGPSLIRHMWRKHEVKANTTMVGIDGRVKKLESDYIDVNTSLKKVIQFIEGSPDPFLRNADGTPVVTGGLLEFMDRIKILLKDKSA